MILEDVIPLIRKIMAKENLTVNEAKEVFKTIFKEDKEGYIFLAFITALSTKGETSNELHGLYEANKELCPEIKLDINENRITDLSGTGGAKLKTINVSTAASFILAGAGICVAKQAQYGVTSPTGSADVFKAFGIDISKIGTEKIKKWLPKIGIIPYHHQYTTENLNNRSKLVRKVLIDQGVKIRTPFHIASFVFTPIMNIKRRVYGVFDKKYLHVLAELFQKAGYVKGIVCNGLDGLSEISNIGSTKIVEFDGSKKEEYIINPEDFGIKKAEYKDIKAINKEQNIIDFLRILYNREKGPKRDIVLMNAAVSFYVMNKVSNFKDGVKLAEQILEENKAIDKLTALVEAVGDIETLNQWRKKANIT